MTCWYETGRISGDCDRFAHNPEVAGSNPVSATKEGALTRPNGRRHQLAAGSFCERCERAAVGVGRSYAVNNGDGRCYRWVRLPQGAHSAALWRLERRTSRRPEGGPKGSSPRRSVRLSTPWCSTGFKGREPTVETACRRAHQRRRCSAGYCSGSCVGVEGISLAPVMKATASDIVTCLGSTTPMRRPRRWI